MNFIILKETNIMVLKRDYKKYQIDYLNLNVGDGVIFDPYLIHGTGKKFYKKN